MKYEFKPSFDRSINSLTLKEKQNIKDICLAFIDLIERQTKLPLGIGLKHLHADYWKIRKGLRCSALLFWNVAARRRFGLRAHKAAFNTATRFRFSSFTP